MARQAHRLRRGDNGEEHAISPPQGQVLARDPCMDAGSQDGQCNGEAQPGRCAQPVPGIRTASKWPR